MKNEFYLAHRISNFHSSFFILHSEHSDSFSFKYEVHSGNEAEKSGEVVPMEALSLEEYIGNE